MEIKREDLFQDVQGRTYSGADLDRKTASDEVDRKAKTYCNEHEGVSYEDAVRVVLDGDPKLASRYLGLEE